ncbi:MAG: hypothetical protein JXA87_10415, partial [Thermoleophilia bacterium]|nr:hypothetical protein [Thermoleophilia bacterium]
MANKLTQLRADEVSAVDKAANRKKFLILKRATESVEKVIKHEGDKWVIYSQDGTKALGTYDTKKEASDRLAEIERFKKEKVAKTILGGWLLSALRKAAGNSGPTTEVEDMTAEEIKKAIADGAAEALTPINERIEKLEAAVAAPAAGAADGADPAAAATGAVAKKEGDAPDEGTPT